MLILWLALAVLLVGFVLPLGLAAAGYQLLFAREKSREPLLRKLLLHGAGSLFYRPRFFVCSL